MARKDRPSSKSAASIVGTQGQTLTEQNGFWRRVRCSPSLRRCSPSLRRPPTRASLRCSPSLRPRRIRRRPTRASLRRRPTRARLRPTRVSLQRGGGPRVRAGSARRCPGWWGGRSPGGRLPGDDHAQQWRRAQDHEHFRHAQVPQHVRRGDPGGGRGIRGRRRVASSGARVSHGVNVGQLAGELFAFWE